MDFYRHWHDRPVAATTSYEAMRRDTPGELQRVVRALTGQALPDARAEAIAADRAFEKQARRRAGTANNHSFLRKGAVGDWVNSFTPESRKVLDHYAGDALCALGYAEGRDWVTQAG